MVEMFALKKPLPTIDAVHFDVDDGDFLLPHAGADALHRVAAVGIESLRERHLRGGLHDAERPRDDLVVDPGLL